MSTIKISELHPAGYDLFQDSESFLNELTERQLKSVVGGSPVLLVPAGAQEVEAGSIFPVVSGPVAASVTAKTIIG